MESDLRVASAESAGHPGGPSSASVSAWRRSPPQSHRQLEVQLRQQSLKPARVSHSLPSPPAPSFPRPRVRDKTFPPPRGVPVAPRSTPGFGMHPCNLLEARVVIRSYNDHLRLLSPEPFGWGRTTKAYSGLGANLCRFRSRVRRKQIATIRIPPPIRTMSPMLNSPSRA
jgi:hypothetical protein